MSNISDTIAFLWSGVPRTASRHMSIVIVAVVLCCATACGDRPATTDTPGASSTSLVTSIALVVDSTPSTPAVPSTVAATTVPPSTDPRPTGPRPTGTIDELVGEPGRRVHLRCVGQGTSTVLLISGFGMGVEGWAQVESAIAARTRVCSYERPGTGTSDPATSTTTFTTQATELHALLGSVGEPGPYVVVGHSFGGAEAVTFASRFTDEVAGLVLVDASPAAWPTVLCAVPDDGSAAAAIVHATCDTFAPADNGEHLDVAAAFTDVSDVVSLGALPMAVITATDRELPTGLAATEVARLTDSWNSGQQAWVALSTKAHLVTVAHTSHHIEIDQPGVVIDEITRLLP